MLNWPSEFGEKGTDEGPTAAEAVRPVEAGIRKKNWSMLSKMLVRVLIGTSPAKRLISPPTIINGFGTYFPAKLH